jgi:hypothetical protein
MDLDLASNKMAGLLRPVFLSFFFFFAGSVFFFLRTGGYQPFFFRARSAGIRFCERI